MANICEFRLVVTGSEQDLEAFTAAVESRAERINEGPYPGEFLVILDAATWGRQGGHEFFWAMPWYYDTGNCSVIHDGKPVRNVDGGLVIVGESKWCPPCEFIEQASSLFPTLDFDLQGTTEHELFEHWTARNGRASQVEKKLVDPQTEVVLLWQKDGKVLVEAARE